MYERTNTYNICMYLIQYERYHFHAIRIRSPKKTLQCEYEHCTQTLLTYNSYASEQMKVAEICLSSKLSNCEDNSQTVTVPFQQGAVNFVLTHNLVTNEKAFD